MRNTTLLAALTAALWACDDGAASEADPEGSVDASVEPNEAGPGDSTLPDAAPDAGPLTCAVEAPALDTHRLTIDGPRLRDAVGREVLLRGVNTGGRSKLPPFFPFAFSDSGLAEQAGAPTFAEAVTIYADRLVDWGLDVARVPFTWEAVEPTRGTYDDVWLGRYVMLLEALGARGIRTIVDFHQDVFARPLCGDGFPIWAVPEPVPERPDDCTSWFTGYLSDPRVQGAYDRFWANEDGLRDAFADMWRHVAAATWDVRGVIGFEVINEPGWGTAEPGAWQPDVLAPFYAEMAGVLREVAPDAPIFFDATGTDAVTARTFLPRPDAPNLVFAPHSYDGSVFLNPEAGWNGRTDFTVPLGRWAEKRADWSLPVLVGEFGIQPSAARATEYVRRSFDAMDTHLLHATLWEYSSTHDDWNGEDMALVDGDGRERETVVELVRAYPAAVSGALTAFRYDAESRAGELAFEAAPGVSELVLPVRVYPEGVDAWLTGVPGCVAAAGGRLLARTDGSGPALVRFQPAMGE